MQRQEEDCRKLAAALGWWVSGVYKENDTSAFRRRQVDLPGGGRALRVVRPEFRRLVEDVEHRRVDALIAYDLDRVARDPRDLEDLIDLVEQRGCQVKSVTGSLRLDSDADVTMARVMVAVANKASRDTSRRVARRAQQRAEQGRWHGGWAPLGYEFDRDAAGRVVGLVEHPERAELVREAARRVLQGDTLYAIVKDFNARGFKTAPSASAPQGKRWSPGTLKRALLSPALIGQRRHRAALHPAQWPALLDEETWKRVHDILSDPRRAERTGGFRSTARKQALSGLAVCGCQCSGQPCGSKLYTQPYGGKSTLVCASALGGCGHIRINYQPLERRVLDEVGRRLDDVGPPVTAVSAEQAEQEEQTRQLVAADETRLARLQDDYVDGLFDRDTFVRQQQRLADRLGHNRAVLADLQRDRMARDMPTTRAEFDQAWTDLRDLDRRAAMLGHFVDRVVVKPHPTGVATHLSRRRSETQEVYERRQAAHLQTVLTARVAVSHASVGDRESWR